MNRAQIPQHKRFDFRTVELSTVGCQAVHCYTIQKRIDPTPYKIPCRRICAGEMVQKIMGFKLSMCLYPLAV
ncbi:hypothetical protein QUB63_02810 [Microcoleus sp. ARI1-B5]|uniref:hypothetical protein n=1 Tax=Microcoleus sp. ARI1-A2 TaxID=2818557 RepID=UPI002FD37386